MARYSCLLYFSTVNNQLDAKLYFSTSFDPFDAHKVLLDSPWTALSECDKKLKQISELAPPGGEIFSTEMDSLGHCGSNSVSHAIK